MEKLLTKSKINKLFLLVLLVGFVSFGGISYYLFQKAINQFTYWDLTFLLVSCGFGSPAFFCVAYLLLGYKNVRIFKNRVELSYLGGFFEQTVHLNELSGYWIADTNAVITIITKKQKKHTIREPFYDNFYEIRSQLVYKIGRKFPTKGKVFSEKLFIAAIVLLLSSSFLYFYYKSNYYTIKTNNLTEIVVTLAQKPMMQSKNRGIILLAKEYPEFRFNANRYGTDAFISNTEAGKRVYLTLDKETYQQKLSKEKPLAFWQKHNSYNEIGNIYAVRSDKITYFTPENYIECTKKDAISGYFFVVIIALYLIYEIIKATKNR